MIGAIIAAAISAVATGIGSAVANKRKREAEEKYAQQQAEMIGDIDKELNSNYLDRADSRNAIRKVTDANTEAMRQLNTDAIRGGATDEAKVAMASQLNKRTADVVGDIAAIGEQHKDSLRRDRRSLLAGKALHEYQVGSDVSGIDRAIQGVSSAASAIGAGIDGKSTTTDTSTPSATTTSATTSGVEAAKNVANRVIANNPAMQTILDPAGKAVRDALGDNQFKYGQTM